jgi:hypothetical protein
VLALLLVRMMRGVFWEIQRFKHACGQQAQNHKGKQE